jgi:NitT/TauT family transport system substrate-binding protein
VSKRVITVTVIAVVIIAVVVGLYLSRNNPKPNPPKEPFHIAFNEWVGFAPFFLAKEKGFYGDLPVEFDFVALEGDKRAGLYAGRFQMICETTDMFQTNRDSIPYPGKIVFAIDESHGGDGVIAIDSVKSLKDLKDKTAVSEPGQPAHFILQYLLHKEGMTLNDIKIQNMTSSDAAAAFIAGRADIAGTYEPYLSNALQKRKGSHLLVSSKDLPGLIVDVAIVNDDIMQKRNEDLRRIYSGWCKAVDYFNNNRSDAVAIMAKAFKLKPEEFEDTISGLRYFDCQRGKELFGNSTQPGPIFDTFKSIGEILQANGLTNAVDTPAAKIDLSIVNSPNQ